MMPPPEPNKPKTVMGKSANNKSEMFIFWIKKKKETRTVKKNVFFFLGCFHTGVLMYNLI